MIKNFAAKNPKDPNIYRLGDRGYNTTPTGSNIIMGFHSFYKHKIPSGLIK